MLDGDGTEIWIVVVGMKVSCQKCILPKSSLLPTSSIPNLEVLAKPCVLALEGFFICDNCYASQSFPRLKNPPSCISCFAYDNDSRSLPLDEFHLVNVPETY